MDTAAYERLRAQFGLGVGAAAARKLLMKQARAQGTAAAAAAAGNEADEYTDHGAIAAAAAAGNEADEQAEAAVFANYTPKLVLEGKPHPDPVVETATLAAMSPPVPTYKHKLTEAVKSGTLSSLQIESVIYAFQRFEGPRLPDGSRAGFVLGDGAGVGKGRQIAGCAYEHWRCGGRRVLWISVSSDLRLDAARDLDDLGLDQLPIYPHRGSTAAIATGNLDAAGVRDGVLFFTYSLLIASSKNGSRLQQVINWLSKDASPLIIFDECHKCKNYAPGKDNGKPTKTALCAVELQQRIPNARILYASATGASTPSNLAYMVRLGTFGMPTFKDLLDSLNKSGLGSMELFAMGLKATGAYVCRCLSYQGAEFELATVQLTPQMRAMYDKSTLFWNLLHRVFKASSPKASTMAQFWGAHQRFYRQMILAAKVPALAKMAVQAVTKDNMAVVIGLQSTGEANTSKAVEQEDGDLEDWVSTPQVVLSSLIESQFSCLVDMHSLNDYSGLYTQVLAVVSLWTMQAPIGGGTAGAGEESGEEDGDEVVLLAEKSLDEVEADKLERAKLEGLYIDLSGAHASADEIEKAEANAEEARLAMADVLARRKAAVEQLKPQHIAEEEEDEAPKPASAKKKTAVTVQVNGRALRAGARAQRVIVVDDGSEDEPSDSSGSDEDGSEDGSEEAGKQAVKKKAGVLGSPSSDWGGIVDSDGSKEVGSGSDDGSASESDSDDDASDDDDDGSSEEAEEETPAKKRKVESKVKLEGAAPSVPVPSVPATAAAKGKAPWVGKKAPFVKDEEDLEEDLEGPAGGFGGPQMVVDTWLVKIRDALIKAVVALELPPCPLDHLIDLCGGSEKVAEMTGRKMGVTKSDNGKMSVVKRNEAAGCAQKNLNVQERNCFMDGDKLIAIISDAASTGISLQADKRVANGRRRLHITLELPWQADKAIQQFGRSHRSNQVSAPIYRILVTPLGGERRFAASAAKRLLSLGALLRGDRKALGAGQALKDFDFQSKWGTEAVKRLYKDMMQYSEPLAGVTIPGGNIKAFRAVARKALVGVDLAGWTGYVTPASIASGDAYISVPEKQQGVPRFFNRLLGVEIELQQQLFTYFTETFDALIVTAKSSGKWDDGVVSLKAESISAVPGFPTRIHTDPNSGAETKSLKLMLDRGVPFDVALKRLTDFKSEAEAANRPFSPDNGFYKATYLAGKHFAQTDKPLVVLAVEVWTGNVATAHTRLRRAFRICRPNVGYVTPSWLDELKNNYVKIGEDEAKAIWSFWHTRSLTVCTHGPKCSARQHGFTCSAGMRKSEEHLIIGAVLPVWNLVTQVVKDKQMRVVRTTTDNGEVYVGLHLESEKAFSNVVGAIEGLDAAAYVSDEGGAAGMEEDEGAEWI